MASRSSSPGVLGETARVVAPLAILGVGFVGLFLLISGREAPATRQQSQDSATPVETVKVERYQGDLVVETDGTVVPYREIVLSAEVGGRIVEKASESRAGTYVTQGQLLARIDPRSYRLAVERSQQELNQADVNLKEVDVEIDNTKRLMQLAGEQLQLQQKDLRRQQELYRQNVVNEGGLDEARQSELKTRNNLVTLQNQLQTLSARRSGLERAIELAKAKLEEAQLNLERTEIRTPINGVIYRDEVEQDSYVQPGSRLFVIEDTSAVEVKCSLQMEELHWLWQPGAATGTPTATEQSRRDYQIPRAAATIVYALGDRQYQWKGVLHRFEGLGLDEKTRTVPCRVLVPRPRDVLVGMQPSVTGVGPRALLRGMFVTVNLHAETGTDLLRLPERAVRPGNTVWRVLDGKLDVLKVPVAQVLEDWLLFRADATRIRAGDQIVVSPLSSVSNGMPVRPVASHDAVALAAHQAASEEAIQ